MGEADSVETVFFNESMMKMKMKTCRNFSQKGSKLAMISMSLYVMGWFSLSEGLAQAEAERAQIELGPPFRDHAILQQKMPAPVWGWSDAGRKITVNFGGQEKSVVAGEDGKWVVELDPLEATAEPQEMVISDDSGKKVSLKNVLVGEVWMASGQSNMQWIVGKSAARELVKAIEESGETPPIRECKITDVYAALHPIEHAQAEWTNDGDYSGQSAIAFAFAHKLYQELGVPIGILNCSFSQTSIEAWVPRNGFAEGEDEHSRTMHRRLLETDPRTSEHKAAWETYYRELASIIKENEELVSQGKRPKSISEVARPGNLDGNRDASWLFNARLNPMIPYAIRGAIWNQGYANMGDGLTYYHNLHALVRGWRHEWERPDLPVYFHQFYSPGRHSGKKPLPSIDSTAEMRLGTWLARDIPHTGMASQIDIEGAIHYRSKVVPGRRLALHALKNQYNREVVADGPMFKSYVVKGDQLIVEFEHVEGGLVVANTKANATGKKEDGATGFADPKVIDDGADQVELFYLAGEDRVWHPAEVKIDGGQVILTSESVKQPRGVSYGTGGIGFRPALYNTALLPMTPFIYYDNELVTSDVWPTEKLKVAGVEIDESEVGKTYDYRRMALLSTQFRDRAVFQAGQPVTIWGSAVHPWVHHGAKEKRTDGEAVIHFRFNGIEKTIPVTDDMLEWEVTVPPMEASDDPKKLEVRFTIDGELVHERVADNIVVGDVWYVATPGVEKRKKKNAPDETVKNPSDQIVRVIQRKAKRSSASNPSRFSVAVSTWPGSRFASEWSDVNEGFAAELGHRLASKTGNPVGLIFMGSKEDIPLKSWMSPESLQHAPNLVGDYKQLASSIPGTVYYDESVRSFIGEWKKYWSKTIPEMIAKKRPTKGETWGRYPSLNSDITTKASETYNVMVYSFTPASLRGMVLLTGEATVAENQGAHFGQEIEALANGWKREFGRTETPFIYTMPATSLASKVTTPEGIEGVHRAVEISAWPTGENVSELVDELVEAMLK